MGNKRIQVFPPVGSLELLSDILARSAWHFSYVESVDVFVPLVPGFQVPDRVIIPDGFDPEVQRVLDKYLPRVRFQIARQINQCDELLESADVILKIVNDRPEVDAVLKKVKKPIFRVDPRTVRQEGSFFIQCAFDLAGEVEQKVSECKAKFENLARRIGRHKNAWVMATGPSIEKYSSFDFDDSLVIVCNSVVLNEDIMRVVRPSILVFADPIFHFGVSQYAGRFREVVRERMASSDLAIVVPLKYYSLLIAVYPEYRDRIIGVPFERLLRHNFKLTERFVVKTTANILTLLLLPLATTFADSVKLIGCDGRPLDQDDYFWAHGKTVQINDKMENIKRVHPAFFAIDYNEYYFEHCHTLQNFVTQAEARGWKFGHAGPSYIPVLRDRPLPAVGAGEIVPGAPGVSARRHTPDLCVVIEPDGINMDGHYVPWHRNLVHNLRKSFSNVTLLCNRKQDPALYNCHAVPTFTSFSWGISRADHSFQRDFYEHPSFKRFVDELVAGLCLQCGADRKSVSIYIYYGSVQILKAIQLARVRLREVGVELRAFVCLFHESVIFEGRSTEPRFPPNASAILYEAAAQVDFYRVAAVTEPLAELILSRFGVSVAVFPNPAPALSDEESNARLNMLQEWPDCAASLEHSVLFPVSPRPEKGGALIAHLLRHLATVGIPAGVTYRIRGSRPEGIPEMRGVEYYGDHVSGDDYWKNLRAASVVVIPYLAPGFTYRTSGILIDALLSGAPVVVMNGTWLASIVKSVRGGLAIDYRSPTSITSAINVLSRNRNLISRNMISGVRCYVQNNCWSRAAGFAMH